MAITFDDPPLNEVALGRLFLPRPDFLVPYFGAFWKQVSDEFPKVAQASPIFSQSEGPLIDDGGVMLPRVWLLSPDSVTLVQLQQNRFHYNWRQTDEKRAYVRFQSIQAECLRLWEQFDEFVLSVTGQSLQPTSSELTYINFIELDGAKNAFEIAKRALQDTAWSVENRILPQPTAFVNNYTFDVPQGHSTLHVSAASARRKSGASEVLKLELTVRGKQQEGLSFEQWSTEAHDFLVAAFKDLTKPEMHAVWKLRKD